MMAATAIDTNTQHDEADAAEDQQATGWAMQFSPPKQSQQEQLTKLNAPRGPTVLRVQQFAEVSGLLTHLSFF
jgi:hypothetical protein